MNKTLLTTLVIAIIVGGGAFYGGMKYAESKSQQERQQKMQALGKNVGGFRNRPCGQQGSGFAAGEIISKDDESVTLKLQDGVSKIVFLSESTEITKSAEGALNDLEIGKNITVNGAANSDGSITAQSIQLRPQQ